MWVFEQVITGKIGECSATGSEKRHAANCHWCQEGTESQRRAEGLGAPQELPLSNSVLKIPTAWGWF